MSIIFALKVLLTAVSINLLQTEHLVEAVTTVDTNTDGRFSKYDVIQTIQEIGREISYLQWEKDPSKNVILSPLSIAVILNLLMLGSNGTSNLEIKQVLNYPTDLQESVVHETYQEILTTLPQSGNEVEINLYTRLFPQKGFTILKSFMDVSKTSYLSDVESLDFANFPVASTDRINNWVSEGTNGKIEELFSEPLDTSTVCVIANVIFLNATWLNKFDSNSTKDGDFFTGTKTISIPMMNGKMKVPYGRFDNDGFEMISLPYVGNQSSMYILKPIIVGNLQQIENNLNSSNLYAYISQMESRPMDVTIPRFKLSLELDVKVDLMTLGVNDIFTDSADFTRFTDNFGVYISTIVHKAILEVTEAGTVAAAATGASFSERSALGKFKLNQPALVIIRDNIKHLIYFWGKVTNPEPLLG